MPREYRITKKAGLFRVESHQLGEANSSFPWKVRTSNYATQKEAQDELDLIRANDIFDDEPWLEVEGTRG